MKTKIIAKNTEHLKDLIKQEIKENGLHCDLNHIDVSQITDMNDLFCGTKFNGDISQWDVSNVEDMSFMFAVSHFNNNISQWNVSNVKHMSGMFSESAFNGDISQWNVSKVECMQAMFFSAKFDKDISNWQPLKLEDTRGMLHNSKTPIPYWAELKGFEREKAIKKYQLAKELNQDLSVNNNNEKKLKI